MGVCLSKEEQLQCTQCKQPLIDLEKSTLLCDTMSNPACQMRRLSLETPRFSAEIGEMVGALIHKAIPKPFDSSLCGWTSETLLPSPDILRNCSSRRRPKKSCADEMSNAEKACREARINACTQDCCITGEENVSIKYNPMLGNRRIQRSNNELESDAASSDGSEDEIRIPVPTNSPERDWTAAISSPAFHHTPNCSHKSVEDGEEKNASDHYAIAHGTPETVLCKGHGRGESMWAMSAGEEFFTDWEMGGETGAAADKATRTRAASNEIAVFNAEDYFKDNAVEEITSTNAELNAGSCEYVATASASASCAENSEVALSSNLDSYRCDPCSEKPCCMQAEEVSLLGSTRSTLSASKSSQNSESTPRCRSKRQRCRQLIGSIKMLTTEAHQLFAINQSDHASRMPCFFNPRRSTSVSKSACKKAKGPAVKARINIAHAEESPHCKPFSQVDQRGEVMPVNQACDFFNFCKLAAGSDAGGADAFVTEPSHARLSALQKRVRFPATPSLSDAVHAFGSPLTVLRNSTDRETCKKHIDSCLIEMILQLISEF
ncbi:hypothetical protein O6H91_01G149600 [Diphasiastrum complanatum]|uniref:Uncharacterized protein n=1 Tax=Diphasiastrum complanatum TaxID=34168 RepID=A0ACC2EXN4_DIPCM|nr:hypothetical protein O6H91_01G149600 [Diphasiastrum complanatum]